MCPDPPRVRTLHTSGIWTRGWSDQNSSRARSIANGYFATPIIQWAYSTFRRRTPPLTRRSSSILDRPQDRSPLHGSGASGSLTHTRECIFGIVHKHTHPERPDCPWARGSGGMWKCTVRIAYGYVHPELPDRPRAHGSGACGSSTSTRKCIFRITHKLRGSGAFGSSTGTRIAHGYALSPPSQ